MTNLVRETLAHYYDSAYLQSCELGALCGPLPPEQRPLALRQLLRQAIETLKPPRQVPYGQEEWVAYISLWERYVARRNVVDVYQELNMSRSAYYRHEQQALQVVAALLWAQHDAPQQAGLATDDHTDRRAIDEAVRIAQAAPRQPIDVAALLEGILQTLAPLARANQLVLTFRQMPEELVLYGDPASLRQIVITLIVTLCRSASGGTLELQVEGTAAGVAWRLVGSPGAWPANPTWLDQPEMALPRALLKVYGAQLDCSPSPEDGSLLRFVLPRPSRRTVLTVDDDDRNLATYQRVLEPGYVVWSAHSAAEAWQQIEQHLPDILVLDILMPHEDGWFLLQRLKTDPRTRALPVIVYSVLLQPSLALSLGAAAVLRKPIEQQTLLDALENALP